MSRKNILLAGAGGVLGIRVLDLLVRQGHSVRALTRREHTRARLAKYTPDIIIADATKAGALHGTCEGIDTVISCLGAPLALSFSSRAGYSTVDRTANFALLNEARRAAVRRFIYAGVHTEPGYAQTPYAAAHEAVAAELARSPISTTVVEPTGLFSAFADVMGMIRRFPTAMVPVIGDGAARTNPVHQQDVANAIVDALEDGPERLPLGGPDVFTRRELAVMLGQFAFAGRKIRTPAMPLFIALAQSAILRPLHPRLGELMEFIARVSTTDCLAPPTGTRRLADYLARVQRGDGD